MRADLVAALWRGKEYWLGLTTYSLFGPILVGSND